MNVFPSRQTSMGPFAFTAMFNPGPLCTATYRRSDEDIIAAIEALSGVSGKAMALQGSVSRPFPAVEVSAELAVILVETIRQASGSAATDLLAKYIQEKKSLVPNAIQFFRVSHGKVERLYLQAGI
jgi:hypothetical protein